MGKKYDYEYFIDGVVFINTEKDSEFDMESACELLNQQDQRIAELEEQLKNAIVPKFKPNEDLFVIVGYKDETKSIEQYYIDEIVIRGNGKLIEYRDIEQEMVIGENNLLFATYEEAQAKLEELSSTNGQNE